MIDKIKALCDKITYETQERLKKDKLDCQGNLDNAIAKYIYGKKYIKIDMGGSGKYMIDNEGNIYGIKAYGVINRGHYYGTLDTIGNYFWGNHTAYKRKE